MLIGIPGTVGGALRGNTGTRGGDVGQWTVGATVITTGGELAERGHDDLIFGYRESNLDEPVILDATFHLEPEDPRELAQRMQKHWILKKAAQPLGHQCAGCIFKDPRGSSAGELIDRAALKGTRIGGAVVSERHANFIIAEPDCTSQDVLRLIELVRSQVHDRMGVSLEAATGDLVNRRRDTRSISRPWQALLHQIAVHRRNAIINRVKRPMNWTLVLWDYAPGGNVEHVEEHDLTTDDVDFVLENPQATGVSRSSDRPCVFGHVPDGRYIVVVCEEGGNVVIPVTACQVPETMKSNLQHLNRRLTEEERARHAAHPANGDPGFPPAARHGPKTFPSRDPRAGSRRPRKAGAHLVRTGQAGRDA